MKLFNVTFNYLINNGRHSRTITIAVKRHVGKYHIWYTVGILGYGYKPDTYTFYSVSSYENAVKRLMDSMYGEKEIIAIDEIRL